jgi:hypothetical protein
MSKRAKKQKKEVLPAPEEFAAKHGITLDTARALLGAIDKGRGKADEAEAPPD